MTLLTLAALLVLPTADLSPDVLRKLPKVVDVSVTSKADQPTRRIVHVLDWRFVDKRDAAIALRAQGKEDTLDERHAADVAKVERAQAEQLEMLSTLVDKHGVKEVWRHSLCEDDMPSFAKVFQSLTSNEESLATLRSVAEQDPEDQELKASVASCEASLKDGMLAIGAAGILAKEKKLRLLPAEDKEARNAANPLRPDGTVVYDAEKIEARQSAIVKNILAKSDSAVLILGGEHDLSDNVPDDCEYIRVTVKAYRAAAGEK
jgi:hypothetical protein